MEYLADSILKGNSLGMMMSDLIWSNISIGYKKASGNHS
jgi:hypothetical protein